MTGASTKGRVSSGQSGGQSSGPSTGSDPAGAAELAETAARLRLAVMRLSRKIRQQTVEDVTQSQVSVLASVERAGTPTLGELAAAEQVRPPSMTRQVDTLVAAGLLDKLPDPADGRVARVQLTAAGRRALHRSRSLRTAYLVRRLEALTAAERAQVTALTELLERMLEEEQHVP